MADPRFFKKAGPFTLSQIAEMAGAELADAASGAKLISDVAPLQDATSDHLGFLDNKKYVAVFKQTKAGACFVRPEMVAAAPASTVCLVTKNPYRAYAMAAQAFYPQPAVTDFRAPSSVIDATAVIGAGCYIDHGAVIGAGVKIAAGCRIGAHTVIADNVEIGEGSDIGANAYVTHALIGKKVRIYPGAVIGRPGLALPWIQQDLFLFPSLAA